MKFEHFIGIDYSGAKTPESRLKGLQIYVASQNAEPKRNKLDPDQFGELRDSSTGIYALLPASLRTIGAQVNGFEQLHNKAFDRMERDPAEYKPANLLTYLNSPQRQIDFSEPV